MKTDPEILFRVINYSYTYSKNVTVFDYVTMSSTQQPLNSPPGPNKHHLVDSLTCPQTSSVTEDFGSGPPLTVTKDRLSHSNCRNPLPRINAVNIVK